MTKLICCLIFSVPIALPGPLTLMIDRSHSIAGFAGDARGVQLGASLKRICTILSAQQPVQIKGFSGPRHSGEIYDMNLRETESLFRDQANFGGSTPLVSVLHKVVSEHASNVVLLTDG